MENNFWGLRHPSSEPRSIRDLLLTRQALEYLKGVLVGNKNLKTDDSDFNADVDASA